MCMYISTKSTNRHLLGPKIKTHTYNSRIHGLTSISATLGSHSTNIILICSKKYQGINYKNTNLTTTLPALFPYSSLSPPPNHSIFTTNPDGLHTMPLPHCHHLPIVHIPSPMLPIECFHHHRFPLTQFVWIITCQWQ